MIQFNSRLTAYVLIALVAAIAAASNAATIQPFVRSRYSLRWRLAQTTENIVKENTNAATENASSKAMETSESSSAASSMAIADLSTTAEALVTVMSVQTNLGESLLVTKETSLSSTTELPRQKTSTLFADYDYYGNGEADGSNNI